MPFALRGPYCAPTVDLLSNYSDATLFGGGRRTHSCSAPSGLAIEEISLVLERCLRFPLVPSRWLTVRMPHLSMAVRALQLLLGVAYGSQRMYEIPVTTQT
jgi:hypothetical protein